MAASWMDETLDGLPVQGRLWHENLSKDPERYKISTLQLDQLYVKLLAAEATRQVTLKPETRTPVTVERCRRAHNELAKVMRHIHKNNLTDLSVEEQKLFGYKKISDGTRTPSTAPKERAGIRVLPTKNRYQYRVFALNRDTTVKPGTKPGDAHGACFASMVTEAGAPAPTDPDEMPGKEYYAGTRWTFTYNASDMGKMVYFAVCYTSRTNKRGPWSEIVGVLIT